MGITTSKKVKVTGTTVDAYVNIANIQINKRKERVVVKEATEGVDAIEGVKAVEGQPEVLAQDAVGVEGEDGYQSAVEHQDAVPAVKGVTAVPAVPAQRAVTEMQEKVRCSYTVNMYASRGIRSAFSRKHFEFNFDLDSSDNAYVQCYANLKTQAGFDDAVDAQP